MLKWRRIALAIVVLALVALWFVGPPQEVCEPAKQIGQEQCPAYRLPLAWAIQVGKFLDLHNGLIIAAFTGTLWWSTFKLWKAGEIQADKMERSAVAMEGVKESMAINATKVVESVGYQKTFGQMQMRAYVSVLADGFYQDDTHIFEARPTLKNTGHTPAHGVKWRIKADILPVPLPEDFDFPLPDDLPGEGLLNPQQDGAMSVFLDAKKFPDQRLPEAELADVKLGKGRGFYTWGIISYRDVFGENRCTKFAHLLLWFPRPVEKGKPKLADEGRAQYLSRHNEAN